METPPSALVTLTAWDTEEYGTTTQPTRTLIEKLKKEILQSEQVSTLYCTLLDVSVSGKQKEEAESVGVTLIPATRNKWLKPHEDPPGVHWFIRHDSYYPELKQLQNKNIKHVVGYSSKTHAAAAAIKEDLFPQANLHKLQLLEPAALFINDAWDENDCGLTGFHRTLIQDFCARKNKERQAVKVYSTVADVKISDTQRMDAEKCGVTLIPATRRDMVEPEDDKPDVKWLMNHEVYFPDLKKIENVQHVVGYAPKTAIAAAYIRDKVFSNAELVLINHAYEDQNCQWEADKEKLSRKMLKMANEADIIFSLGPKMHDHFVNQYRANVGDKELLKIPHEELLPMPRRSFFDRDPSLPKEITTHQILTYGQIDTPETLKGCEVLGASIGSVANKLAGTQTNPPKWLIQGISQQACAHHADFKKSLEEKINSRHIQPTFHSNFSAGTLITSLHQSHLCIPTSCYKDYGFCGVEGMATGIPTFAFENSELGWVVKEKFPGYAESCLVSNDPIRLSEKITSVVSDTEISFARAKELKKALKESVNMSCAMFASLLTPKTPEQSSSTNISSTEDLKSETSIDVHVQFDENEYHQHHQKATDGVKQQEMDTAWKNTKRALKRRASVIVSTKHNTQEVKKLCSHILGDGVKTTDMEPHSLQISLDIPRHLNLCRLERACKSRIFSAALEPILITDEMREEAAEFGIPLKLTATYDQARFNELELFFLKRDGGGIQSADVYDDITEAASGQDIQIEKPDLALKGPTGKLADSAKTDISKDREVSQSLLLEIDPRHEIQHSAETYLCLIFKSGTYTRWKAQQYDIIQLPVKMMEQVQHILSFRAEILALLGVRTYLIGDKDVADLTKKDLEEQITTYGIPIKSGTHLALSVSTLARALLPYFVSPKQLKEYNISYHLDLAQEKALSLKTKVLQPKKTPMRALKEEPEFHIESSETNKNLEENITALQIEKIILEHQLKEAEQQKSILEKQHKEEIRELQTERSAEVQSLKKKLEKLNPEIIDKEFSVLKAKIKDSSKIIDHLKFRLSKLSVSDEKYNKELQQKIAEILEGCSSMEAQTAPLTAEKSEKWSSRTVYGHSGHLEQQFKRLRGLAIHNDQLLVCNSGNNIVQILNQDYTCKQMLGNFNGQFAKPFKPQSVAVSKNNLYFILDESNMQIVVCDQSNTIIRIISLPTDSEPFCIALVNGFVLVTDIKGHRILKYTLGGKYVAAVGGRGHSRHTYFNYPFFVAVNSRNVIMVSDCYNDCIKCFDIELNYLYQFGQFGRGNGELYGVNSIAIDADDNVYVCDAGNNRIVKWNSDGKWICNLFEGTDCKVINPWYMAVTATSDTIAVRGHPDHEIKVFSK